MSLYLAIADAFSGDECDRIVALAEGAPTEAGPLYGGAAPRVDPALRDVRSSLVKRIDAPWLFDRLDALFTAGADAFSLPVGPISEAIQILLYEEGGHFRMWHSDAGVDKAEQRRISMSIELSDPADHDGGDLEVVPDLVGKKRTMRRGGAHLFPSRALHRVTEVRRGRRWALVAWTGA